jgi:hypothetical protein
MIAGVAIHAQLVRQDETVNRLVSLVAQARRLGYHVAVVACRGDSRRQNAGLLPSLERAAKQPRNFTGLYLNRIA